MKHLRRLTVFLMVPLGLVLITPTGSAAQVLGGIHICHVFSPSGPPPFDTPVDIIIPVADLPIHLAHGDTYPVPAGGCGSLLTTTTMTATTTTVPITTTTTTSTTTTTAPPSTSTSVSAVPTTVAGPTVPPTSSVAGVTEPGVGELPVTGDDVGSLGAAGVVLLTAGAVITARSRRRRSTPPS